MAETSDKSSSHSSRALSVLCFTACAGLGCVFLFALQSGSISSFFSVAFAGLLLSGASLLVGGALGFLFGIPRTLQPDESSDVQSTVNYRANTNLEQISDWLTKMLVGVGLTQLPAIPEELRRIGKSIAPALGDTPSAPVMAVSILIFFAAAGFLFGFLWTRLYLATAFRQADIDRLVDRVEEAGKKIDAIQRQSELDAKALNLVYRQLTPDADAESVPQKELNDAISGASASVRTQIFTQAWRMRHENWHENKPLMERTVPVFRGLVHSDVGKQYHQNYGQLGYALKDKANPEWGEAETALTSAINIRGPVTETGWGFYEFNRAICRIMTDAGFSKRTATDESRRNLILADLCAARSDGREKFIRREKVIKEWMELNNISMHDLEVNSGRPT